MKRAATVLTSVLLTIGIAACESGDSDGGSGSAACLSVPGDLQENIEASLTVTGGGSLEDVAAVRSDDFESVYFVAGEIDGPGLEGSGDVGIWATNDLDGGLVFSVDAVAEEFSDWASGADSKFGLSTADHGVEEAENCL